MDPEQYQNIPPEAYDRYIETIARGINESAGFKREALRAQMEDARAARANAMKIAQLQASTSRYGIDVASRDRMAALKEQARQFDARHGLDIAEAYTRFSQTPDMLWVRDRFLEGMQRVGQGRNLPRPLTSAPAPQPKTYEDFAAIAQYNGSQVPGASSSTGSNSTQATSSGAGASSSAGSPQAATDPRTTAATAVLKALPPSEGAGANANDFAALNAVRSLYEAARPGSLERLGPMRSVAAAGLQNLGYPAEWMEWEYERTKPNQVSPLLA